MNREHLKYLYIGAVVVLAAASIHWMSKNRHPGANAPGMQQAAMAKMSGVEIVSGGPLAPDMIPKLQFAGELAHYIEVQVPLTFNNKQTTVKVKAVNPRWPLMGRVITNPPRHGNKLFALNPKTKFYGIAASPEMLKTLGAKRGDLVTIGKVQFRIRAVLKQWPGKKDEPQIVMTNIMGLKATELLAANTGAVYHYQLRFSNPEKADAWKQQFAKDSPDVAKLMHDWPNAAK